jgi:hypothetical protein
VRGDTLDEIDETYTLNLSDAVNATIADGQGLGTITDDDPPPQVVVDDVTVTEGNAGTANATFTVGLDAPSGRAVSVEYSTANGTATAPTDYTATGAALTFPAGQTTRTFTVLVNGDLLDEPNETFFVNLGNATNATIADGQGVGTIADDDAEPALTINDVPLPRATSGRSTPPSLSASTRRAGATSPSTSRPLTSRRTHRPTTWGQAGR